METICIIVAFNGRWTEDYKYLDHQTKLVIVPEAIRFEDFIKQIFEVIELDKDKFEAVIWFDINLGTNKGMLISKDLDLHTCMELLKSHSLFKGCRFIVDISERVFGSTRTFEDVNRETQHDNQNKCQHIMEIYMVEAQPITEEVVRSSSTRYSLKCNDDRCGWCVRAFRIKDLTLFKIVKIEKNHDCSINTMKADQRHVTSKLISGYTIDNLRDPRFEVTPVFVMAEMQKLHGLDIGFVYMFYAYGSSISGWNHCRPVIAVDATFLKSKFHGVLMISVSKDANNQIFPLAFGIAEFENNNSYEWYINMHQSIAYAIAKVYPESHHEIYIYHLELNLKRRKVKSEVIKLFQTAARVYRRKEFDLYMSDIAKVDKKTYDYLMEEPPERWARSCSPRRRYDMLTTNIVESMNSVLLEARELPILRMMDFIQVKLQRWFYEKRNEAEGTFYDVSCWVEEKLKKKIDLTFTLNVFPVDSWRSRVEEEGITFLLDLNKRTCDCFQFQFDELPCIHAIAAIEKRNIKKSKFCSHCSITLGPELILTSSMDKSILDRNKEINNMMPSYYL
ncbi:uncharacterized protein [Nicotiana sylvestris]|uniref:uncharacterized protein n=1 Tax=Nicotiana sylvestris TaxID=4096 RepID=UPI00388CDF8E